MGHAVAGARASNCRSISSGVGRLEPMASIPRLIDDLGIGIRNSAAKRTATGLRLTPHTTAREQDNRITLWLIGWEVETPVMAGVKSIRCFLSLREEPCAKRNR